MDLSPDAGPARREPHGRTFHRKRGEFFSVETIDGEKIRVKWDWDDLGPEGARWRQRFSHDDGLTWNVNWTAHHTRGD